MNVKAAVTKCRFRQTKGREEKGKGVLTVEKILYLTIHAVIAGHVINKNYATKTNRGKR